ncbi:sugar transferase [Geothrix sp. 21YS21S-2]|uniref:sugar transferase n=1 Tax=Geothrix sp. 21YS21S-2 TaxID=3068893 RepID=UPI0027B8CAC9|nr:sugar transferase [Geothrix sp. 21YS21S-2]
MIRLFDFFSSLLGLVVLSPFLLLVGLLVKLEDGGAVFYRQVRVGRHGRPFRILKFRTMAVDADRKGPLLTVGRDVRITRLGAMLRAWKIDELPQLVNVLTGDMGLVGPRPEVPRYVSIYSKDQARVLELRPGITDAASIAYRYENDLLRDCEDPETFYKENILPNKIRINLEYAAQATFSSNIKVILATLGLLPPPVKPIRPGERRAFDRTTLERPVLVTHPGAASAVLQAHNISRGGMLVEPHPGLPEGSPCTLALPEEGATDPGLIAEGVVTRNNGQGTAVRFAGPLGGEALKSLDPPQ